MTGAKRRPKGTGSVRNRGTERVPRWFGYYFVTVDGKRHQISEGPFRRKVDAETWLRQELQRAEKGRALLPGRMTDSEVLDAWLEAIKPRVVQSTYSEYRRQVDHRLKVHLGDLVVGDLRPDHVQRMLVELRKPGANRRSKSPTGLSETTLQHTLQALRTGLDWAVRQRLVGYNIAKDVDRPQRDQAEMSVWTAGELGEFMRWVADKRFAPLLRLAAFTGMRRSELLGLRWREVDLDRAVLRVRRVRYKDGYEMIEEERTKSRRGRRAVDLDPGTVDALRNWAEAQQAERTAWSIAYAETGMVFTAENGEALHADRIAQAFERWARAAPVPTIRFHDLRHTHASLLLAQGVPVVDVAQRLGDSPETILSTYAHFIPGQGQKAAAAFAEMVDDGQGDARHRRS